MELIDYDGLKNFLTDSNLVSELEGLTEQEKQILFQMAKEFSEKGSSNVLKSLWNEDYDEVPVDIDTFLDDPRYFGDVVEGSIYPYWREMLRNIFAPGSKYFEVIFSCLTGDTLICCSDGYNRKIKDIVKLVNKGEVIYVNSYNRELGIYTVGRVINGVMNGCKTTWEIFLDNGKSFKATKEHKVLMENNEWKETGELQIGDRLFPSKEGEESRKVTGKEYCAMLLPVYDIEVEITHNFILSCDCIVHNCLTGDTEIPCLDGKVRTIKEIVDLVNKGEVIYVYSFDRDKHEYTVGKVINGVMNGCRTTFEVTLDNGKSFRLTSDHKILMRDNTWKETKDLRIGDSLMPFDRKINSDDREFILQPKKLKEIESMRINEKTYKKEFTHYMSYKWKMNNDLIYNADGTRKDIHHKDKNHRNNNPENLIALDRNLHLSLHGKENLDTFNKAVKNNEEWAVLSLKERQKKGLENRWKNEEHHRLASERMTILNKEGLSQKALSILWQDEEFRKRHSDRLIAYNKTQHPNLRTDIDKEKAIMTLSDSNSVNEALAKLNCSKTKLVAVMGDSNLKQYLRPDITLDLVLKTFNESISVVEVMKKLNCTKQRLINVLGTSKLSQFLKKNHKVIKIDYNAMLLPVYDIEIETCHNFALDAGCTVKNCSIGQ